MRLVPIRMFRPEAEDELRPAARPLCKAIHTPSLRGGAFALIAVPGAGKSSALIDVGRENFTIFIQASEEGHVIENGPMKRQSVEFDYDFIRMSLDVAPTTTDTH